MEVLELRITSRGPVCIGSGATYQKQEYLFDSRTAQVSILDRDAFIALLVRKGLEDAYEQFILGGGRLDRFLRERCRLRETEIDAITRYTVSAADALNGEGPLREIAAFQRDPQGRAYLPGSGVKGALRTAFLVSRILRESNGRGEPFSEERYLNQLRYNEKRRQDAVNDLFRGVRIADSAPIPDEAMILAGKVDVSPDGSAHSVNLCRECLRPGETVRLVLTLDQSLLRGRITADLLRQSITDFSDYYRETYLRHFTLPAQDSIENYRDCLMLGAGTGFFAKTVTYPYYGEPAALKKTAQLLQRRFRQGKHEQDEMQGISPHTLKYTRYNGRLYPFGVCGVELR
ncbi:MAG TPA: type III-A CRISPR-associated RAMP protein Csm5 [Candidatus Pygmaiobacter gallistercoris]|nr:type III-A CRISPR-associated RAMP protein Csm5 [Candidatus Pygmaiobacter gallistercoris]